MPSLAHPVALPLANDPDARWRVYPLFGNPTPTLEAMHCHMSVLSPGHSPHPPHSHREEELIVFVDGEAELIIPPTADPEGARRERAAAGAIVYYPPWQFHTLRNASNRPVTYAVFRWLRAKRRGTTSLPIQVVCVDPVPAQTYPEPFHADLIFEGSTPLLGKLHSHLTTLQPGGGYAPHADPYDVAQVVLSGTIETLGGTLHTGGVAYCDAGTPHGMKNVGEGPARYVVFEFHAPAVSWLKRWFSR